MLKYPPDAWDAKGQLRLPLSYWLILLLQARSWVLFVLAGASRQQASAMLALFYPDPGDLWVGLIWGIPAAIGFLLSGWRQRFPRIWRGWRWVLAAALLASFIHQCFAASQDMALVTPWMILTGIADLLALVWLLLDRRLRDCFNPRFNHAE
ncbi:hypothetical protein BTJ39_15490 [Izhakiella australiensis]|uniref:DUF2919 domain-containing protein n=1 Tax=Izhakiella australiensis TaxID=1926881 RepID=A0A1S8YJH5_9GAMM|nr:DUF2919 domain-containing protein [Izhakiella australiensis]OON39048.1 hypothetical protein BTJ39_15490 [Izhakiella australiensis]